MKGRRLDVVGTELTGGWMGEPEGGSAGVLALTQYGPTGL